MKTECGIRNARRPARSLRKHILGKRRKDQMYLHARKIREILTMRKKKLKTATISSSTCLMDKECATQPQERATSSRWDETANFL
jgi:hypothetical protein